MSNGVAIAVATEGLKSLLLDAFAEAGPIGVAGATVTSVRPHDIDPAARGVNVFLYQVTPNVALRNADLPTRREAGELIRRPQLALDLHYLLTFVGEELTLEPQRLMGVALAALHARPVLTPAMLDALAQSAPTGSFLRDSDLARQVERVRFTLSGMNLEEFSKLWSVLLQTPYQLSTAVQASTVLIEAPLTPSPRRPVLRRGIYAGTPRPPSLGSVEPQSTPRTVSGARARLALRGVALSGVKTRARLGEVATDPPTSVDDATVVVAIPDALPAGVHAARVLVSHAFDEAGVARVFELESNAIPFVLEPRITTTSPLAATVGGALTLDVEPPVRGAQVVRVIVGGFAVAWQPPPSVPPTGLSLLTVTLPAEVTAGRHPLRVEVDGATSALVDPPETAPPDTPSTPFVEVT